MTTFPVVAAALKYSDRVTLSTLLPVLEPDLRSDDTQLDLIGSVFLWSLDNPARLWRGAAIPAGRIPP